MQSETITFNPGETVDLVLEVYQYTSKVSFDVTEIVSPDNSTYAVVMDDLEVSLQSAIRSENYHPIAGFWTSALQGDANNITVEDGPWTWTGEVWAYHPIERGLMNFTLAGDFLKEFPVSFRLTITRENFRQADKTPFAKGQVKQHVINVSLTGI